jgi:paraquat-inducible protein A
MAEVVVVNDLERWRECRDCGLFQQLPDVPDGEAAICARCDSLLRRAARYSVPFARMCAVAAAILFVLALSLPLVDLRILDRSGTSTVFSGPTVLRDHGLVLLAAAIFVTLVLMPAAKLIVVLSALFGVCSARPPRWLPWVFGWLEHISPWAMVEVFLLGSMVAYSRLKALAQVDVGLASLALAGAMLALVAVDAALDREAIWQALGAGTPRPEQDRPSLLLSAEGSKRLIGCSECRRVARAYEGAPCPRCGHHLSARKGSFEATCALVLGAALLYIPANVLPVMTVKRLGKGGPTTILHGVVELAQDRLWPLALLVLLASIVIPIFKLVSLALMLVMTRRRSSSLLKARTRLFRFVRFIGRWSMIDIFMLSILVGVVRFGSLASVLPEMGAVAFCAVVLTTMGATELFDPRRMWDAAGREDEVFDGKELSGVAS